MEPSRSENPPATLTRSEMLRRLPPEWPASGLREATRQHLAIHGGCVVVLDDDPTGTQTAHDVWVLTRWQVQDLVRGLGAGDPALYILTNTRSMQPDQAAACTREVTFNLAQAMQATRRPVMLVSRSDSTLRGHFPVEVDALSSAWVSATGQAFDGVILVPFFAEGGRWTVGDVHWVADGDRWVPVAQTAFARDHTFGFSSSRLPDWVEEKTGGQVPACQVTSIPLEVIRPGGPDAAYQRLSVVRNGQVVVINAASYSDLDVIVTAARRCEAKGQRFLYRTAASFVKAAAGLHDYPLLTRSTLLSGKDQRPGLVVFGSHVPQSTAQLYRLLEAPQVAGCELSVPKIMNPITRSGEIRRAASVLGRALRDQRHALLYTSRAVTLGQDPAESLRIARSVSMALAETVRRIDATPGFVLAKGGITASDLATGAMGVRAARVLGQMQPGAPVWLLGSESRWPGLPYIVFPGNVGDTQAVAYAVTELSPL